MAWFYSPMTGMCKSNCAAAYVGFFELRSLSGVLVLSERIRLAGGYGDSWYSGVLKGHAMLCMQESVVMCSGSILCHAQELKNSSDQDRRTRLGGNLSGGCERCTGAGATPDMAGPVAWR